MKTYPITKIIPVPLIATTLAAAFALATPAMAGPSLSPVQEVKGNRTTLEEALHYAQVSEGWNQVAMIPESDESLWAWVVGGQIIKWEVRNTAGRPLPTEIALSENPSNLRIVWRATNQSPLKFIEEPAWVIRPETAPDF